MSLLSSNRSRGVAVNIPFAGGYTMLHHLVTPLARRSGASAPTEDEHVERATMLLHAGVSLAIRDMLLKLAEGGPTTMPTHFSRIRSFRPTRNLFY